MARWLAIEFLFAAAASATLSASLSWPLPNCLLAAAPLAALGGRLLSRPYGLLASPDGQPTAVSYFLQRVRCDAVYLALLGGGLLAARVGGADPSVGDYLTAWLGSSATVVLHFDLALHHRLRAAGWPVVMAETTLPSPVSGVTAAVLSLGLSVCGILLPIELAGMRAGAGVPGWAEAGLAASVALEVLGTAVVARASRRGQPGNGAWR
jgi:hypothetical protein